MSKWKCEMRLILLILMLASAAIAAPVRAQDADSQSPQARAEIEFGQLIDEALSKFSLLDKTSAGVDPFSTPNATAIIGRPSFNSLLDSAVDFNNRDGTFSFALAPAYLVDPFPDWYATGIKITGSANTEEGSFSVGAKYDLDLRDPRYYFLTHRDEIQSDLTALFAKCDALGTDLGELNARIFPLEARRQELSRELEGAERRSGKNGSEAIQLRNELGSVNAILDPLREKRDPIIDQRGDCDNAALMAFGQNFLKKSKESPAFGLTIGGNANYDNKRKGFDGGSVTLAGSWTWQHAFGVTGAEVPVTINASFEDALPKDKTEADEEVEREKKAGGGGQVSFRYDWQRAPIEALQEVKPSVELGGAFTALACVQNRCESSKSTLRVNPFLAVAITKDLGGRIDFVWEGEGDDFGSAIGGISFKYSFSGL
jgi:hypothetical protein